MILVIVFLIAGVLTGYLIRNHRRLIVVASRLTDGAIFLLLFFLGLSVGMNQQVVASFSSIGLQSFMITLLAVLGSVLVTFLFHHLFFRKR
jgi:uncharacterized membrane protein YbjE (DUF340 family)